MGLKEKVGKSFLFNELRTLLGWSGLRPLNMWPHGHFYSPVVSKKELDEFGSQIWPDSTSPFLPGLDLNAEHQLNLLKAFSAYYADIPFKEQAGKTRYHFDNSSFRFFDGIALYSFIRHFKPRRIIEIGSGFTSSLMLDTREQFKQDIELTFIEPYPALLKSLLKESDKSNCRIIDSKVQRVPIDLFKSLEKNDILFIDSSHVSKTGSDVNYELFSILPELNDGVIIHVHDIFYPFEYPKDWVYDGRNWNEDYLLRAFLSYNSKFKIEFFVDYLAKHHRNALKPMPLLEKENGGSLWMRKG